MKTKLTLLILLVLMAVPGLMTHAQQDNTLPLSYRLDTARLTHLYQGWNNCGPATLTMGLSYFGYPVTGFETQLIAANYLKPDGEDQNVSPWQMVDFVNNQVSVIDPALSVKAVTRPAGTFEMVKTLLTNDFPVIIEEGYEPQNHSTGEDLGWMGHYLLLMGYDDTNGVFLSYDSYEGHGNLQGLPVTYNQVAEFWHHFNNRFIVIYPAEREAEVQTILGSLWDETAAWTQAKTIAQTAAAADVNNNWAWFNLGEAMSYLGEYESATIAFRQAFSVGQGMPFRTLWYLHGAFEAFYQAGQFNGVEELAARVQNVTPYIEEANYYRALVYAAQGRPEDAVYRLNLVLQFNPNFYPATQAIAAIENGTFVGPAQTDAAP